MTVFLVVAAVALVVLGVTLALRSRTTITPDVAEDEEWLDRVAGAAPPDDEPENTNPATITIASAPNVPAVATVRRAKTPADLPPQTRRGFH